MEKWQGFNLRMPPEEHRALELMAGRELRSKTAMIRVAIVEAARRRGLWPVEGDGDAEEEAA